MLVPPHKACHWPDLPRRSLGCVLVCPFTPLRTTLRPFPPLINYITPHRALCHPRLPGDPLVSDPRPLPAHRPPSPPALSTDRSAGSRIRITRTPRAGRTGLPEPADHPRRTQPTVTERRTAKVRRTTGRTDAGRRTRPPRYETLSPSLPTQQTRTAVRPAVRTDPLGHHRSHSHPPQLEQDPSPHRSARRRPFASGR